MVRNVLTFRSTLLPYSETFIPNQAEKFQNFTSYYAGFRHEAGFPLPLDRTLAFSQAKLVGKCRNLAAIFGYIDPLFRQAVRKTGPLFIHAHFEESALKILPLAQQLNLPLFLTFHGSDKMEGARWQNIPFLAEFYQGRRRALFANLTCCFGTSQFICDRLLRAGYPSEKVRLHYIGVDTDRFQPDPTVPQHPVILFVGRLVETKGCADLIRAMAHVRRKFPETRLIIIGEGDRCDHLQKLAVAEKINATFLGRQPPDQVRQWMQQSLLLCLPSISGPDGNAEGLGMVTLEAQAVGLPVVATRIGGLPEAVEHGVTGLLSAERDPAALAGHLITLLADSSLRAAMGQAGRARMLRQFDLRQQTHLLEQHILQSLAP